MYALGGILGLCFTSYLICLMVAAWKDEDKYWWVYLCATVITTFATVWLFWRATIKDQAQVLNEDVPSNQEVLITVPELPNVSISPKSPEYPVPKESQVPQESVKVHQTMVEVNKYFDAIFKIWDNAANYREKWEISKQVQKDFKELDDSIRHLMKNPEILEFRLQLGEKLADHLIQLRNMYRNMTEDEQVSVRTAMYRFFKKKAKEISNV